MSRFKGIERNLKKIKKISVEVNLVQNSGKKLTKEEINDIISQKLYEIWYEISTIPTDYAKINIQSFNGEVNVNILDSNLPIEKQEMLINDIKKINNYNQTLEKCHNTVGVAILNTSITIIFGFSILVLSNFIPTIYFGVFTAFAMLVALVANLTLLPLLLLGINSGKIKT